MENTEGNTYDAGWKKEGKGFVAWLKKLPKVKVTGSTEDELTEQLWETALRHFGDGEGCIEFIPPLPPPKSANLYFTPQWFKLGCNEGLRTVGDRAQLYRDGLCSFCSAGLGGRNSTERVVDRALKGDFGFLWGRSPFVLIVSEAFLNFFGPILGSSMKAIHCQTTKKTGKTMWELELLGRLPLVCHKNATHATGVLCPRCKTARYGGFVYKPIRESLLYAVERVAARRIKRLVFVASSGAHSDIMVNEEIAKRIKNSSLKGVMLDRVALLHSDEIGSYDIKQLTKDDV